MSLKFSATTHSFRIGGWTNSDGNTALSSWNVFFFVKKSNDSKSNQNALAPLPIDGTIADSSMRFFCSSFFFFFCFVLKGNTIPRHATTQSRALGLTVRAAGIVRMFTPRSFALVSFFFCSFVSCVLRRFPTGVTRNPRGCTNRASPAGTEWQNSIRSMMNENSLFFSQCSYAIRSRCVFSLWMNVRPWGEIQQAVWWPFNNVPNK